jgi:phosphate uptake regulator
MQTSQKTLLRPPPLLPHLRHLPHPQPRRNPRPAALPSKSTEQARDLVLGNKAIDSLEKQLFEECVNIMTTDRQSKAPCLLIHRSGRKLERVGDPIKNIAEDLIYMQSGNIVRHEAKKLPN